MLRSEFAVQQIQAKRFAGVVPPEYRFEFSTSRQTRGCNVSFGRVGWIVPHSRSSVSCSAAAEIISGKVLFAFLKGGPVPGLGLYSNPANPINAPGATTRRVA